MPARCQAPCERNFNLSRAVFRSDQTDAAGSAGATGGASPNSGTALPGGAPGGAPRAARNSWGFAERTAYPGSVEHYRVELQRYVPPVPVYNARTLVKNFRATELAGVARELIVDWAEPVY